MKKEACALCELVHNTLAPAYSSQQVFGPGKSAEIQLCRKHDKEFFLSGQDSIIRNYWNRIDFENKNHKKILRVFEDIYASRNRNAG
ncbi:MAG: hypothetical protein CME64_01965 [Halobacteriovoraceae bacterium]|nr:hypothetical protein [Halobacteriovoraceae bacterium]|tara:strand:- start:30867 stop:31127 length:261 start_codon:yes stop_codon:yes gene_type:complete